MAYTLYVERVGESRTPLKVVFDKSKRTMYVHDEDAHSVEGVSLTYHTISSPETMHLDFDCEEITLGYGLDSPEVRTRVFRRSDLEKINALRLVSVRAERPAEEPAAAFLKLRFPLGTRIAVSNYGGVMFESI